MFYIVSYTEYDRYLGLMWAFVLIFERIYRERGLIMMEDNVIIKLQNISKNFEDDVILDNINLSIKDKEFMTFLGPSGCG